MLVDTSFLADLERAGWSVEAHALNRRGNVGIQAAMIPRFWSRMADMTMVVI